MRKAATRLCAGDLAVFVAPQARQDYADAYQTSHRRDAAPERKPTNRDAEFYHMRLVIKRPFCGHGMEKKHVAVARRRDAGQVVRPESIESCGDSALV